MKLTMTIATLTLAACVNDPNTGSTAQDLTRDQVATLNQIGRDVGLSYSWTDATRSTPATLGLGMAPVAGLLRQQAVTGLDGGFETHLTVDPNAIDPCWFLDVRGEGQTQPVVSVRSLSSGGAQFGNATFLVAGTNYTIQGLGAANDPNRPSWALQFVVKDAAGNIVFDSTRR